MKSPIKEKPLRNPGESLDQQIDELLYDKVFLYIVIIVVAVTLAALEWYRWYFEVDLSPASFTLVAVVAILVSAWKISKAKKEVRHLKQGRDGEKAVGQFLEQFRKLGFKVFHDIPANGFNLDHVIIAKSGIYVIETKSYSKPDKGDAKVTFDGEKVSFNGAHVTDKPVVQVRAARNWLRQMLKSSTSKDFEFRPVVLFPGWYVQPTAEAKASDVWVLNPKALPGFVKNSQEQLSQEDVSMAALHLSRYVRTFDK